VKAYRPDMLISDVMMPRMDGFALVKALRSDPETRRMSIILLSARTEEEAGQRVSRQARTITSSSLSARVN